MYIIRTTTENAEAAHSPVPTEKIKKELYTNGENSQD